MDYSQILEELYVGSCPQATSDIDTPKDAGITAVLNLQTPNDETHWNIDWQSLKDHYQSLTIELRRVSIRDFDSKDLTEKLPASVKELNNLLSTGYTVYLHCTAGVGRSPTVAIAYLAWKRNWNLSDAYERVRSLRYSEPYIEAIRDARRGQNRLEEVEKD